MYGVTHTGLDGDESFSALEATFESVLGTEKFSVSFLFSVGKYIKETPYPKPLNSPKDTVDLIFKSESDKSISLLFPLAVIDVPTVFLWKTGA